MYCATLLCSELLCGRTEIGFGAKSVVLLEKCSFEPTRRFFHTTCSLPAYTLNPAPCPAHLPALLLPGQPASAEGEGGKLFLKEPFLENSGKSGAVSFRRV